MTDPHDSACKFCNLPKTPEGHDGCLGTLPGIMNACCGHGGNECYVQFLDGNTVQGEDAFTIQGILKRTLPDSDRNFLAEKLNYIDVCEKELRRLKSENNQLRQKIKR